MSKVQATVADITQQIVTYTPAVMAGVQAAEVSTASGSEKAQAVINAIQVGSAGLAQSQVPNVAAIAGLVNLVVSIFNALGIFSHKAS